MTWFDYVALGLFLIVQVQLRRLDKGAAALFLRNVERCNGLVDRIDSASRTAHEAHRRCSDAVKDNTELKARISELYERCNSLQSQINVANRAASGIK